MRRNTRLVAGSIPLVLGALFWAGCNRPSATERSVTDRSSPPDRTPPAIAAFSERFGRGVALNEPDSLAVLYAEDAVVLGANRPRWRGRQEIRKRYGRFLDAVPDAAIEYRPDRIVVGDSDSVAFEYGTAVERGTLPDGTVMDDAGKWLVAWERIDGTWRIVAHAFSLDEPPSATPPSEEEPTGE